MNAQCDAPAEVADRIGQSRAIIIGAGMGVDSGPPGDTRGLLGYRCAVPTTPAMVSGSALAAAAAGANAAYDRIDELRAEWVHAAGGRILRLCRDGEPIGSAQVEDLAKAALQVSDLRVGSAWRGRGYGRLLLAHVVHLGARLQRQTLVLVCADNGSLRLRRWYLELGFAPIGVDRRGRAVLRAPIQPWRWPLTLDVATGDAADEEGRQAELSGDAVDQRRDL